MRSCLYEGEVVHRRVGPPSHAFRYRLGLVYLDLAELPWVFSGRLLWSVERPAPVRFRRRDYPGHESEPLDATIRAMVERETGRRPAGAVRLLTNLRSFGLGFHPVSFFYCFAEADAGGLERLEAVVALVTNTPWGESHSYVIAREPGDDAPALTGSAVKRLHVSPFLPMDLVHEFRFEVPGSELNAAITDRREGRTVFSAGLRLAKREITTASLASMLARYPWSTARVLGGIYLQALRLYRKNAPFFAHPGGGTMPPSSALPGLAPASDEARRR
jgi:DUF1365 family protein